MITSISSTMWVSCQGMLVSLKASTSLIVDSSISLLLRWDGKTGWFWSQISSRQGFPEKLGNSSPNMVKGSGNPPRKCPKLSASGIMDQFAQMIGHTNLIGWGYLGWSLPKKKSENNPTNWRNWTRASTFSTQSFFVSFCAFYGKALWNHHLKECFFMFFFYIGLS